MIYAHEIKKWIKEFPPVRALFLWSRKHSLPGFRGIPIYFVTRYFVYGLTKHSPFDRAAAMTFKFFMALFPAILFFCTLIPLVPIEGFQDMLLKNYEELMPPQVSSLLRQTVVQVVNSSNTGLMSVSFLAAFFFSTNGIVGMIRAMNASANITEPGGKMRLKALGILVFVFIITVGSILGLAVTGNLIKSMAGRTGWAEYAGTVTYIVRLISLYIIILLTISLIYFLAPARKFRLGFISPGAFSACNLSIISSVALAEFFANFDRYNTLYGTLGSIPVFLIWIFINCLVLLTGFELNAGIAAGKLAGVKTLPKKS
jgi:membrane protein